MFFNKASSAMLKGAIKTAEAERDGITKLLADEMVGKITLTPKAKDLNQKKSHCLSILIQAGKELNDINDQMEKV